jgi:hypothetical protein
MKSLIEGAEVLGFLIVLLIYGIIQLIFWGVIAVIFLAIALWAFRVVFGG